MKQLVKIIMITLSLAFSVFSISAEEQSMSLFKGFVQEGINNESFKVNDLNENDITDEFLEIYNRSVSEAYDYICDLNANINYTETIINRNGIVLASNEKRITKSNKKFFARKDLTGSKSASWTTVLTGTYYINKSTGNVIRALKPKLSISSSFGIVATSVNTSYILDSKSVTFKATFGVKLNNGRMYDFGNHTHSFVG